MIMALYIKVIVVTATTVMGKYQIKFLEEMEFGLDHSIEG